MIRCINLDWLEVYCLEDYIGYPHNAEYFRRQLYHVEEREYGTPVYKEMFTVFGRDDQPLLEIRRAPKSAIGQQKNGVLEPMSCHVRLVNRSCYFEDAAGIMLKFLEQHNLCYQRISRVDVALDFERFDSNDEPQKFIKRYMAGRYAKINQCNISAHGQDSWNGRVFNSLKWGQPGSMVSTKLYCKSVELATKHDKPYIKQAWRAAGLIDDVVQVARFDDKGQPIKVDIWRVEFSIKSGTKSWFRMVDRSLKKKQIVSVRNDLVEWRTRAQMWHKFISLCQCYFHFKHVEYKGEKRTIATNALRAIVADDNHPLAYHDRQLQRKDRCADKVLFYATKKEQEEFIKLGTLDIAKQPDNRLRRLLAMLLSYRDQIVQASVYRACDTLIEEIQRHLRTESLLYPWPEEEIRILQEVLAINSRSHGAKVTPTEVKALHELQDELFKQTSYEINVESDVEH